VHAIMAQGYIRKPSSRAVYEYPAYAMQLEFLRTELQDNPLQTANLSEKGSWEEPMNDIILGMNPFLFAGRAHRHFQGPFGSCVALKQILEDRAEFIVSLPF
jgi:hypothetical protein